MSPPSSTTLAPVVLIHPGKYTHPKLLSNIHQPIWYWTICSLPWQFCSRSFPIRELISFARKMRSLIYSNLSETQWIQCLTGPHACFKVNFVLKKFQPLIFILGSSFPDCLYFPRKCENGTLPAWVRLRIQCGIRDSVPGTFKLSHLKPVETILF